MRDGQCSLFSSFSPPWSDLSFLFFFSSYFAKLTPLLVHVKIRQKTYVFFISNISLRRPLSFPMIYECFCFSHLHLFVVVFLCSLLQVWMFYTQGASELSYWKTLRSLFMQCSPPFFSFPGVCVINTMSPKLWLSLAVCLQENQWPALAASIHFLLLAKVSPILILSRPGHISGQYSHLFSDKVSRSGIAFLTVSTNVCIQRFVISKLAYSDNLHLLTSSENTNIFLDSNLSIHYAKIFHQQILFQLYFCCPSYRVLISIFALALLVEYPACLGSDICAVSDVHCLIAKVSPQLIPHC